MIKTNMSKLEYKIFLKYYNGKSPYWFSGKDKILTFHGSEYGEININKLFLYFFFILGFKFNCCYSKRVQENLGFGNYLNPDSDQPSCYIGIDRIEQVLLIPFDLEDSFLYNLRLSD